MMVRILAVRHALMLRQRLGEVDEEAEERLVLLETEYQLTAVALRPLVAYLPDIAQLTRVLYLSNDVTIVEDRNKSQAVITVEGDQLVRRPRLHRVVDEMAQRHLLDANVLRWQCVEEYLGRPMGPKKEGPAPFFGAKKESGGRLPTERFAALFATSKEEVLLEEAIRFVLKGILNEEEEECGLAILAQEKLHDHRQTLLYRYRCAHLLRNEKEAHLLGVQMDMEAARLQSVDVRALMGQTPTIFARQFHTLWLRHASDAVARKCLVRLAVLAREKWTDWALITTALQKHDDQPLLLYLIQISRTFPPLKQVVSAFESATLQWAKAHLAESLLPKEELSALVKTSPLLATDEEMMTLYTALK